MEEKILDKQNEETKEEIELSQEQSTELGAPKMSLEEISKRENQYKALVDFFKKDIEIKTTLMNLVPKSTDEYSEDSRMLI